MEVKIRGSQVNAYFSQTLDLGQKLCSTDTDTCIGIGPIRIRRYDILKKRRYEDTFS